MSDGHAFQWSPGGLIPMATVRHDADATHIDLHPAPATDVAPLPALSSSQVVGSRDRRAGVLSMPYPVKDKPFNVIRETRMRVREIKRELRCHKALQKELAELERLLSAARGKTPAPIQIASRRAG